MIAEIVDTNGAGSVDPGDTINMGQYPTTPLAVAPAAIRKSMEDWPVRSHPVTSADLSADLSADPDITAVYGGATTRVFQWLRISVAQPYDAYQELDLGSDSKGDDGFIDVEIYAP